MRKQKGFVRKGVIGLPCRVCLEGACGGGEQVPGGLCGSREVRKEGTSAEPVDYQISSLTSA